MSFSNPNVELTYNGNGSDDTFGVNFTYLEGETSSIAVELWDYTDPDLPVQQSFVLNVDYTIDESGYPATNVVTTSPVPVNYKLFIYRNTPKIQPSSFVNGPFPAESVEESIDRVAFMGQETDAKLNRALLNPIGGPSLTIQDVQQAINLTPQVAQNTADISTNAGAISTNAGAISTNAGAISTNAGAISTNAGAISDNANAIALLSPPSVVVLSTASTTHNAANAEYIIVKESNITINLPAPTSSYQVKIKMDDLRSNVTVNHASGIDGFGLSYTLSSSYESISLVADGTQWYIF